MAIENYAAFGIDQALIEEHEEALAASYASQDPDVTKAFRDSGVQRLRRMHNSVVDSGIPDINQIVVCHVLDSGPDWKEDLSRVEGIVESIANQGLPFADKPQPVLRRDQSTARQGTQLGWAKSDPPVLGIIRPTVHAFAGQFASGTKGETRIHIPAHTTRLQGDKNSHVFPNVSIAKDPIDIDLLSGFSDGFVMTKTKPTSPLDQDYMIGADEINEFLASQSDEKRLEVAFAAELNAAAFGLSRASRADWLTVRPSDSMADRVGIEIGLALLPTSIGMDPVDVDDGRRDNENNPFLELVDTKRTHSLGRLPIGHLAALMSAAQVQPEEVASHAKTKARSAISNSNLSPKALSLLDQAYHAIEEHVRLINDPYRNLKL